MNQTATNIAGKAPVTVTTDDGNTETVDVCVLKAKEMGNLLGAIGDPGLLAEVYARKPKGWAETLTPTSLREVVDTGERLNSDFFAWWVQGTLRRIEMVSPGAGERLLKMAFGSTIGSPK
jgi:hypothetical protein